MWKSSTHQHKSLRKRILAGSVILLSGSGLATAINFVYNIAVARFLGPSGYGSATVVYTILILLSSLTLSFQIISAKIVAQQSSENGKHAGYRGFHRAAWVCGIFAAILLLAFRNGIATSLRLHNPILIALLAVGVAFYIPLGSRRGYLQGAYGFHRLAVNLVLEGAVRLGGSLVLIFVGLGVPGVIAANSAAVAVAYFAIRPKRSAWTPRPITLRDAAREMWQGVVFFSGQVLINNCDIVLVKYFFVPESAGIYAAVAMVGRVVFSISQAVVNSMFPLVAGTEEEERRDLTVIATALMLVLGIGCTIAVVLRVIPTGVWTFFLGSGFHIAGKYSFSYLLALYAITTVTYCLSAVIITFEMSYKIANTSFVQLAFSGIEIGGICLFHSSLRQVILVQLVVMMVLFVFVSVPFLISSLSDSEKTMQAGNYEPVRAIRRVSEDEIIAEFLKSDFHKPEFRPYQSAMRDIVNHPNLDDADESARRRTVFFVRHQALWNELPGGTEWFELEVEPQNLGQIRLFPRAQWRKLAHGNFGVTRIVEGIRKNSHKVESGLLWKIRQIGDRCVQEDVALGSVILIGTEESAPLTILDGNHRLVATMLASPASVKRLRFLCGLSPRMMECCWYNTNLLNLLRYGTNVFKNILRTPTAEVVRFFRGSNMIESRE